MKSKTKRVRAVSSVTVVYDGFELVTTHADGRVSCLVRNMSKAEGRVLLAALIASQIENGGFMESNTLEECVTGLLAEVEATEEGEE